MLAASSRLVARCRAASAIGTRGFATAAPMKPKILITGSLGQIGVELAVALKQKYGRENVIASDVKKADNADMLREVNYVYADVCDYRSMEKLVVENQITWLIHNASILSAAGERDPALAMRVNIDGLHNALELARRHNIRILAPSSIAAFGPSTPKDNTPDSTIQRPNTIYGVSKVYLELLGEYYHKKWNVDFRSLRYPGIISHATPPGGGTTDYAVDIFWKAHQDGKFTSFLNDKSALPMMYMPDCLNATMQLLAADPSKLVNRTFNVAAFSFTPAELAKAIQKYMPKFTISYNPDFRQAIADSWPRSLDDSNARKEWGWKNQYDLDAMTKDMLHNVGLKLGKKSK